MKTITVTDKMHEFLTNLAKEIKNQDNRATAMPYFFQIQTKETTFGMDSDYSDEFIWVDKENTEYSFEDKDLEPIIDNLNDREFDFDIKKFKSDFYYREEILEDNGFFKCYYKEQKLYQNCFFTEKGIKAHIKANHYHYKEPVDYLSYASRNPEMEGIFEFLLSLVNEELKK